MKVGHGDSYLRRIWAYTNERFPVVIMLVTTCVIGYNSIFVTRILFPDSDPLFFSYKTIFGLLAMFLLFFHLRVMDEFKRVNLPLTFHNPSPYIPAHFSLLESPSFHSSFLWDWWLKEHYLSLLT